MTFSYNMAELFNKGEFWYILKVLHLSSLSFGRYIVIIGYAIICPLMVFFMPNTHELGAKMKFEPIHAIICGAVFVWCVVSLSGVGTFLYFNF